MKKYLQYFILLIIVFGLSSCVRKEQVSNIIPESRIEKDIRDYEKIDEKKLKVISVKKAKEFSSMNKISVLIHLDAQEYKFTNGLFKSGEGISVPAELIYNRTLNDYKLSEIIMPKDGSEYYNSLRKMARNDKLLIDEIDDHDEESLARGLYKKAVELNLENFQHSIDTIPGIGKDYVSFKTESEGILEIVNIEKYNKAMLSCDNTNMTFADGVKYYIKEKIAIEAPIPVNNPDEKEKIVKDIQTYKKIKDKKTEFVSFKILSKFKKKDREIFAGKLYWGNFSFNNGIFSIDPSYETLAKLEYENKSGQKKLMSLQEASSGLNYKEAVKSLLDDSNIYKDLVSRNCQSSDKGSYLEDSYFIDDMVKKALNLNMQNVIINNIDIIPGYEKDKVEIVNEGYEIIKIARKKDIEEVKNKLKEGQKAQVEGILYYVTYGVAVKGNIIIEKN